MTQSPIDLGRKGPRYAMPVAIALMLVIAALYVQNAPAEGGRETGCANAACEMN